jgi:hypothetical protein
MKRKEFKGNFNMNQLHMELLKQRPDLSDKLILEGTEDGTTIFITVPDQEDAYVMSVVASHVPKNNWMEDYDPKLKVEREKVKALSMKDINKMTPKEKDDLLWLIGMKLGIVDDKGIVTLT